MSENPEQEEMVRQFIDVTGADAQVAKSLLESSAWEVDLAIYKFFDNDDVSAVNVPEPRRVVPVLEDSDSDDLEVDVGPPLRGSLVAKEDKKKKKKTDSKFATLQSLQQDSSSDEEEGQAFYAGGSERSGQQIIGPGKNSNEIVSNMFKTLREHGAEVSEPSSGASSSRSFGGTGYRLGATPDDTIVIKTNKPTKDGEQSEVRNIVLKLWKTGFSLDDGELRPYTDPENVKFLDNVRRGEIPRELRYGPEVHVTMEDHRFEDFKRTVSNKPFHGKGQMLGSPAPTTIGSTSPQLSSPMDQEANQKSAQASLNVNDSEPTTNIQFRLADGSRLTGRFNLTHTVANLREYIVTAVPSYQLQNFILQTTFPNKVLEDVTKTISEEGLQNAVVVQRLK